MQTERRIKQPYIVMHTERRFETKQPYLAGTSCMKQPHIVMQTERRGETKQPYKRHAHGTT